MSKQETLFLGLFMGRKITMDLLPGDDEERIKEILKGWEQFATVGTLDSMPSSEGCKAELAAGQWWRFCGETDMGQSLPALCTECGGKYKRK